MLSRLRYWQSSPIPQATGFSCVLTRRFPKCRVQEASVNWCSIFGTHHRTEFFVRPTLLWFNVFTGELIGTDPPNCTITRPRRNCRGRNLPCLAHCPILAS